MSMFTPEDVVRAYRENKLTPICGSFLIEVRDGKYDAFSGMTCAIGALAHGRKVCLEYGGITSIAKFVSRNFPDLDMWSFVDGFDGMNPTRLDLDLDSYELGRATRRAVVEVFGLEWTCD